MPRIWNKRSKNIPADAVYVGRPGILGNPFTYIADRQTRAEYVVATRDEAVERHWLYMVDRIENDPEYAAAVEALRDKDLVCWCAPQRCHAENYLHWLETNPPKE